MSRRTVSLVVSRCDALSGPTWSVSNNEYIARPCSAAQSVHHLFPARPRGPPYRPSRNCRKARRVLWPTSCNINNGSINLTLFRDINSSRHPTGPSKFFLPGGAHFSEERRESQVEIRNCFVPLAAEFLKAISLARTRHVSPMCERRGR